MIQIKQKVIEIELEKHFRFMYSNFVVSSQQVLYLLLAKNEEFVDVIEFDFIVYKYGYPNDEVGHPLMEYGLGFYGFFEVQNSNWIDEIRNNNSTHPRHTDSLFEDDRHYVAKFKDLTLEVIANKYALRRIKKSFFKELMDEQINFLDNE